MVMGRAIKSGLNKAKGKMLLDNAVLNKNWLSIFPVKSNCFHGSFASGFIAPDVFIFIILSSKSGGKSCVS